MTKILPLAIVYLLFNFLSFSQSNIQWKTLNEPGVGGASTSLSISPYDSKKYLVGGDMLGVAVSEDSGRTWLSTFGFKSYEIADFTWHPTKSNEVWVGTMSGPYVSVDGGKNWQERRIGFPAIAWNYSCPIQRIIFDPSNSSRLLAFGGSHRGWSGPGTSAWGAVWESKDGGLTWSKFSQVGTGNYPGVMNAAFAGKNATVLVAAVAGEGIFRSTDGGKTWNLSNQGLPTTEVRWVEPNPLDEKIFYLATGSYVENGVRQPGLICKSLDGGVSWSPIVNGLHQTKTENGGLVTKYEVVVVSPSNPNVIYTSDHSYWPYGIFKSTDGGNNWINIFDSNKKNALPMAYVAAPGMSAMIVDPINENVLLGTGTEYILKTRDGGNTWKDITSDPVPEDPSRFTGRGYSGLVSMNFRFNPFQKGHAAFVAMDDGKFWQSKDDLKTWKWGGKDMWRWEGGNDLTFAGINGNTIYATFGQGFFSSIGKSIDGGSTWVMLAGKGGLPNQYDNTKSPKGIYALPDNPDKVWTCLGGKLYHSGDGGANWSLILDKPNLNWIAAVKSSPSTFYVGGDDGVYKTTDGANFSLMTGSPMNALKITIDPNNANILYVTVWRQSHGGLYKFENNTWSKIHSDTYLYDVDVDPFDSQRVVAVTNDHPYHDSTYASGAYYSIDAGKTWIKENTNLPMLRIECVKFDPFTPNRLVIGTHGRGYFLGTIQTADNTAPTTSTVALVSKTTTNVDLSWTPATDNIGVVGYNIYRGSELIGTTTNTSYKVLGLSVSTPYSFTVKATDQAGNLSAASNTVNVTTDAIYNVIANAGIAKVDGILNESAYQFGTALKNVASGKSDNTMQFAVLSDQKYLYVAVKVLDNNLHKSSEYWNTDAVEIYIDGKNNRSATYDSDDRQFVKVYNDTTLYSTQSKSGVLHATAAITGGYAVEMAIPWTNLGIVPQGGTKVGFDIANNDDDSGAGRTGQWMWNGKDNNWQNTSEFGTLEISSILGVEEEIVYSLLSIFPNPAMDELIVDLELKSNANVKLVITDLLGHEMERMEFVSIVKNRTSLSLSQYPKGMYIVNTYVNNKLAKAEKLVVK